MVAPEPGSGNRVESGSQSDGLFSPGGDGEVAGGVDSGSLFGGVDSTSMDSSEEKGKSFLTQLAAFQLLGRERQGRMTAGEEDGGGEVEERRGRS